MEVLAEEEELGEMSPLLSFRNSDFSSYNYKNPVSHLLQLQSQAMPSVGQGGELQIP
jgi:hypothetical protein